MPTPRFLIPVLGAPMLLGACQSYAPRPLDLGGHDRAMRARDVASADVAEYARRLSAAGGDAGRGTFDPTDGLTLAEAEAVALFFNPELRVARLKAGVPRAGAAEAGRWADPALAVDAERILEGVRDPWVLGGVLNLTLPISGRLGVEREKARAEADVEELRALVEERRVVGELRERWLEWSAALERAELARAYVAEYDGTVERAEQLRRAGEISPLEARAFRIERAARAAKLRGHRADAAAAELEVKARLGLVPGAPVRLVPSLAADAGGVPPESELPRVLASTPAVRLARAEYAAAERALELEVRRQYPDLELGGGSGIDQDTTRALFGGRVPLPLFNRNRRAIAEARAAREASRAAAEAEYERRVGAAAAARGRLDAAREALAFAERELAPLVDEQLAEARRLGKLGAADTLIVLEALRGAHEAKLGIVEARLAASLAARRAQLLVEMPDAAAPAPPEESE